MFMIMLILYIQKLRHRKVTQLTQGHVASRQQSSSPDSNTNCHLRVCSAPGTFCQKRSLKDLFQVCFLDEITEAQIA